MDDEQLRLRSGAAVWREVDGETIVLDVQSSLYLGVNQTGTALWPELAAGTTRDRMVGLLVESFEIDVERARVDVDTFIALCREHDLLES